MIRILFLTVLTALLFMPDNALADAYRIRPGDVVSLEIWEEPDLSGKFKVSPQGKLAVNWLDPVKAEGLTAEELRAEIVGILKSRYIKNPIVKSIAVNEEADESGNVEKGVTVVGAVQKEGVYKYAEGYTAMAAILDAGGFTKFASKNRTYLIRGKGNDKKRYNLKMGDVMDKGDKKKDMLLEPGDMIIVREGFL